MSEFYFKHDHASVQHGYSRQIRIEDAAVYARTFQIFIEGYAHALIIHYVRLPSVVYYYAGSQHVLLHLQIHLMSQRFSAPEQKLRLPCHNSVILVFAECYRIFSNISVIFYFLLQLYHIVGKIIYSDPVFITVIYARYLFSQRRIAQIVKIQASDYVIAVFIGIAVRLKQMTQRLTHREIIYIVDIVFQLVSVVRFCLFFCFLFHR